MDVPDFKELPAEHPTRQLWGGYIMISALVWIGQHWGIISFSASILNEEEGLSFTKIGSFVPTFAGVYVGATAALGLVAERWNQKSLLVAGNLLCAIGQLGFITGAYWIMLCGMAFIAFGYSNWTIVPYLQIRLLTGRDNTRYQKWYIATQLFFFIGFSLGRVITMACVTYIDEDSWWVWRLPWIITASMNVLHAIVITCVGYYPTPIKAKKSADGDKAQVHKIQLSYLAKLRGFYCNSVALFLMVASVFTAYANGAIAAWAPTIATERFENDKSDEEINLTIVLAVLVAWPVGMILIMFAIQKSHNIKNAMRISAIFMVISTAGLLVYTLAKDDFELHIGALVVFSGAGNFPYVFFKQLPDVLGLKAELKVFALSRFTLVYMLFGNIVGVQLTGIFIDEFGVNDTLWITTVVAMVATLMWVLLALWSFSPTGPIEERSLEQVAQDKAIGNWKKLSSVVIKKAKTAQLLADALYLGQGSSVMAWLLHEDGVGRSADSPQASVELPSPADQEATS